jgi:uncharacterized membrane protein
MLKTLKKKDGNIFLISSFILLLINFILPIFKYLSLNTSVYDLGIYLNSLYNINYNKIYSVAFEGHFEPILIPLSFIYEFFNYGLYGVIIILIIQTLSIFSVGIYFLIKKKYQISLIFFLYFPLTYINLFDFHTDSFAIIFFLLFLINISKRKILNSIIYLFLLCSLKEIYCFVAIVASIYFFEKKYFSFKYLFLINLLIISFFIIQILVLKFNSTEIPVYGNLYVDSFKLNIFEKLYKIIFLLIITSIPFLFFMDQKGIKYLFFVLTPYMIYENENIFKFNYQYFIPIFLIYLMITFEKILLFNSNKLNLKYYSSIFLYNLLLGATFLSPVFWVKNDSMYHLDNYLITNDVREKLNFLKNFDSKNYEGITTSNFMNYHSLNNTLMLDTLENNNFNHMHVSKNKRKFFNEDKISSEIILLDTSKTKIGKDQLNDIKLKYDVIKKVQDLIVFKKK